MATAIPVCRPHASEARRPEAGSRAGGVSRAERGNDGSPTGAKPRRGFNAQHDSATGHVSLAGDALTSMFDEHHDQDSPHAQGIEELALLLKFRLVLGRSGAAGSAVFEGRQASRGGDSPQGFPLEGKRSAQRRRREGIGTGAHQKNGAPPPEGTTHRSQRGAISSPLAPSSTATARSRQARQRRKPARLRSAR